MSTKTIEQIDPALNQWINEIRSQCRIDGMRFYPTGSDDSSGIIRMEQGKDLRVELSFSAPKRDGYDRGHFGGEVRTGLGERVLFSGTYSEQTFRAVITAVVSFINTFDDARQRGAV